MNVNNYRKPVSEWTEIWLNRFEKISRSENLESEGVAQMREIISDFLLNIPGAPYCIKPEKFIEYIKTRTAIKLEAIRFFYDKVAVSVKYREKVKTYLCELDKQSVDKRSDISSDMHKREADTGNQKTVLFSDNDQRVLLDKLKIRLNARHLNSITVGNNLMAVSRFLKFVTVQRHRDLCEAFKKHLVWLRDEKKLVPRTINNYAAAISFFLREVLEVNPEEDLYIRMKKGKQLPRIHSLQNVTSIITALQNIKHRLILMLVYGCGLKLGEVCVLKPSDVDLEHKVLWIRKAKSKKDRMVMLDEILLPYLSTWLQEGGGDEYLFEGKIHGKHLSKRTVEKIYTDACSKTGIHPQGGISSLRHSFAAHLLEQGVNLRYVQELLGHVSSRTTEIYTHVAAHKIVAIRSPIAKILLQPPEVLP